MVLHVAHTYTGLHRAGAVSTCIPSSVPAKACGSLVFCAQSRPPPRGQALEVPGRPGLLDSWLPRHWLNSSFFSSQESQLQVVSWSHKECPCLVYLLPGWASACQTACYVKPLPRKGSFSSSFQSLSFGGQQLLKPGSGRAVGAGVGERPPPTQGGCGVPPEGLLRAMAREKSIAPSGGA